MNAKVDQVFILSIAIGVIGSWASDIIMMEKSFDPNDMARTLTRVIRDIENGSGADTVDAALKKNTDIHVFANDSNPSISMIWSGSQGVILALTSAQYADSRLYRSVNFGSSFIEISSQIHNDRIMSSHGMLVSPVDTEHVLLVKEVISFIQYSVLYASLDSGKTFDQVKLKFNIKPGTIAFNPLNSLKLLAVALGKNTLYLSYDFGLRWKRVSDYAMQVKWDPRESNTFYYTKDPMGRMISGGFDKELYRCTTAKIECTKIAEHVFSFGIQGGFIFVSVEYLGERGGHLVSYGCLLNSLLSQAKSGSRVMHVSKDGGNSWDAAQIPAIGQKQFYSLLDMSEDMVFVHVDNVEGKGDGTIYTSGERGIIYSKSLNNHLYPNMGSLTDFYKVSSLQGVYITSQIEHGHDTVHSMITFDKGGTWQKIDPPKGSVCPKTETECQLQIHSLFSKSKGVKIPELMKSTESATGIILAHANIGDALNFNAPDVYVSNDGGYTWIQPKELKGPHYYAIGDSGGLLFAVTSSTHTNVVKYSTDEGETWLEYTFFERALRVTGLSVQPGSKSTVLGLWGWDEKGDGAWRSVTVDFKDIMEPCKKQDYVQWKAHESNTLYSDEDKCLLGADAIFTRKKKGTRCQNGKNFVPEVTIKRCRCTKTDFMCDYGYSRIGSDCVRDTATDGAPLDVCIDGQEETIETRGYRKIPGDKCERGFAPDLSHVEMLHKRCGKAEEEKEDFGVDKSHFTEYPDPVSDFSNSNRKPSSNVGLIALLVTLVLAMGSALIYVLRKRHYSRQRVKYVALSTSEHLTNDVEGDGESMSLIDESVPSPSANRRGNRTADSNGKQGVVSYHDDSDEDMLIS